MLDPIIAHIGHGQTDGHSLIHLLVEPVHVLTILASVASAIALYILSRRQRQIPSQAR